MVYCVVKADAYGHGAPPSPGGRTRRRRRLRGGPDRGRRGPAAGGRHRRDSAALPRRARRPGPAARLRPDPPPSTIAPEIEALARATRTAAEPLEPTWSSTPGWDARGSGPESSGPLPRCFARRPGFRSPAPTPPSRRPDPPRRNGAAGRRVAEGIDRLRGAGVAGPRASGRLRRDPGRSVHVARRGASGAGSLRHRAVGLPRRIASASRDDRGDARRRGAPGSGGARRSATAADS